MQGTFSGAHHLPVLPSRRSPLQTCSLFMALAQTFNLKQLNSPLQDALKPTQCPLPCTPWLENTATPTAGSWGRTQCGGRSGRGSTCVSLRAGEANEVTDHPGQAAAGTGVAAPRVRWNSSLHASLLIQLKMHWTTSTETLQVNSSSLLCCGEATLPPEFTSTQLSAISQGRKYPGCKMVLWL